MRYICLYKFILINYITKQIKDKKGNGPGAGFDIKYFIRLLHFNPWSLDLFIRVPSQFHREHTVLQPFRRIELIIHITISVLRGTYFSPESSEVFEG